MTLTKFGSLFTVCAIGLFGFTPDAAATNINTHGIACENYFASQDMDIDYNPFGVQNTNAEDRAVMCPIMRSPLTTGLSEAGFYVDGTNPSGRSTTCTIYSYNYNNTFLGSQTFTDSSPNYDHRVNLPAEQATAYAYISALCTLPGYGKLLGLTAVQ